MKLTRSWLQEYVDIAEVSSEQLADHLTMLGLEVDSITPLYNELESLKTGVVVAAEKHPDADKLTVCQVKVGAETQQIVCGAPNVRPGLHVVVALPGTVLPGNFKISKSKIRGVGSNGMICSERELELSNDHKGIMELPEGIAAGSSFIEAMQLADTGIEVDLTPNRPDCSSVIGIAREVAGVLRKELTLPVNNAAIAAPSNDFRVDIENPELCPRYAGRLIKNVKIGPSPWWLKKRLLSVGLRPINNIVDVTNYVMMEYGQPLHAFDFNLLAGQRIIVRTPRPEEKEFTTLDGARRELDDEMLLICDGEQAVAVAGVMGGLNSEVSDKTVDVLLESACFNPVSIRRTARKLNLSTDASYRFERGVDPLGTINAINRAVQLICEVSGGTAPDNGIDNFPGAKQPLHLELSVSRTNSLIGIELSAAQIAELLESIEIRCRIDDADTMTVFPPSFRVDIEREADLIEEVARVYGYNKIPTSLPKVDLSYPERDSSRLKRLAIGDSLTAAGFTEAINYSFIAESHGDMLNLRADDIRRRTLALLNPLSEDQGVMRTTLLPGLLDNVRRNLSFQKTAVKLFEIGKVFYATQAGKQPEEKQRLAGILCGNRYGESAPFHYKHAPVDIYDAKGAVEYILSELRLSKKVNFTIPHPSEMEPFVDPGFQLTVHSGEQTVGSLGRISAGVARRFGIKLEIYYFDLDFDMLCEFTDDEKSFTSLPVYPAVKRDIALVVPNTVTAGELVAAVRNSPEKLIEHCEVFDVFRGEKIPAGCKSVALSITYRSPTKTLTEKNVEKSHTKIVSLLTEKFGGSFRNA
jgi:phenylalanyl-tRNA synthetase beta chain